MKQAEAATTATATRTVDIRAGIREDILVDTPVGTLADIPLGIPVARRTAETITGNQ